uniref:Uncharacterized protein n=1 Tax=Ditylenchus dipsaci TaxID=166011 RepID=A0A915DIY0_9BILA
MYKSLVAIMFAVLAINSCTAQLYNNLSPVGVEGPLGPVGFQHPGGSFNPVNRAEVGSVMGAQQGAATGGVGGAVLGSALGGAAGAVGKK